jgi:hypothetical protein
MGEENIMRRFLNAAALGAILLAPIAVAPTALRAQTYHDAKNNEDHQWNGQEDKAYRIYVKQNHRRYKTFAKLNDTDQQAYWSWRHDHTDAQLKIDIH